MSVNKNNNRCTRMGLTRLAMGVMAAGLAASSGQAMAFSIDTGNPDIRMRWDNTVKYNVGWRMEGRNNDLGDSWMSQATNHGWDRGDVVTNRLDLLSEFDLVYKRDHGFRISGAAWNDFAYTSKVEGNSAYDQAGYGTAYPNDRFTGKVERWYKRSGELLDAFVFTRVDIGDVPINIRAGRHNVYWGESMFTFGNGIAYGQGPLDIRKATSTPGVEAKELFLPQNQVSATAQLTDNISVAANYYMEWDPHRMPEGGTYLGGTDYSFLGGTYADRNHTMPIRGDVRDKRPGNSGSWGINTHVYSDMLDSTIGLYYREFDDRNPMMTASAGGYMYNAYAEDVKLYGISLARLIGSISLGAEISRREGTALVSNGGGLALGDTWHGLANIVSVMGSNALYDSATLSAEMTFTKLDSVKSSTQQFFSHKSSRYGDGNSCGLKSGCASDHAVGFQVLFEPVWYQVWPGIDMTMPISYGRGISGNSPTPLGTAKDGGAWSVGIGLDIHSKYEVDLAYNDYMGEYTKAGNLDQVPGVQDQVWAGTSGSGVLEDRGWLSLTLKTAF